MWSGHRDVKRAPHKLQIQGEFKAVPRAISNLIKASRLLPGTCDGRHCLRFQIDLTNQMFSVSAT